MYIYTLQDPWIFTLVCWLPDFTCVPKDASVRDYWVLVACIDTRLYTTVPGYQESGELLHAKFPKQFNLMLSLVSCQYILIENIIPDNIIKNEERKSTEACDGTTL